MQIPGPVADQLNWGPGQIFVSEQPPQQVQRFFSETVKVKTHVQ